MTISAGRMQDWSIERISNITSPAWSQISLYKFDHDFRFYPRMSIGISCQYIRDCNLCMATSNHHTYVFSAAEHQVLLSCLQHQQFAQGCSVRSLPFVIALFVVLKNAKQEDARGCNPIEVCMYALGFTKRALAIAPQKNLLRGRSYRRCSTDSAGVDVSSLRFTCGKCGSPVVQVCGVQLQDRTCCGRCRHAHQNRYIWRYRKPLPHMMQVSQPSTEWIEEALSAHAAPFSACISSTFDCGINALYVTFMDDSVLQGETYNSSDTVQHLINNKPEMILNMVR